MKRFHIHVGVSNLEKSIAFYSALFGQEPTKKKADYAKWQLEDPRLNFAISTKVHTEGVDHLGIQVEEDSELDEITDRVRKASIKLFDEGETTCCYSESKKAWVQDPSGIPWEAYRNMADVEVFSAKKRQEYHEHKEPQKADACCAPKTGKAKCC